MVLIASDAPEPSFRDELVISIMVELDHALEGPDEVTTSDVAEQIVDLLEECMLLEPRALVPARTA
ncbi:MAG: hypothetical protein ACTHLT_05805 [Devosia sp.]